MSYWYLFCKLVEEGKACYLVEQLMLISEVMPTLAWHCLGTIPVYWTVVYIINIDRFTKWDRDKTGFESILQYLDLSSGTPFGLRMPTA